MTFDDDMLHINFDGGTKILPCKKLGVDWPPPERIDFMGFIFKRRRYSAITDEQRAGMTHVSRGAEYDPSPPAHPVGE